jgi:hypothetical protein
MSADPPLLLVWENQRRVLARPGMWTTLGLAFGIPSALAGVVAAILTQRVELMALVPLGMLGACLLVFGLAAIAWETWGRRQTSFQLTAAGARVVPAGAPHRTLETDWADVTAVYCHARSHYILLRRGFADRPVELYCTPENFWLVKSIVQARIPSIQM